MATSLTGHFDTRLYTAYTDDTTGIVEKPQSSINFTTPLTIANGAGANQAADQFTETGTLASAATKNFDFFGGLTNQFGTTISWAKMKALVIKNRGTDSTLKVYGNLMTNVLGHASAKLVIPPGCVYAHTFMSAAGITVQSAQEIITLEHAADGSLAITYDLMVLGTP